MAEGTDENSEGYMAAREVTFLYWKYIFLRPYYVVDFFRIFKGLILKVQLIKNWARVS